jgi:cobalt/nickel transport system permease protein
MHRRDARAKLLALLIYLVILATASRGLLLLAGELLLLLSLLLAWAKVPLWNALSRAALVLPFAAVFSVISWIAGEPSRGLALTLKSYLSGLAVLTVVATTPLPDLLRGLRMMGVPRFLLEVAQFLYRYLFVISEEAQHMARAASSRGGGAARQWWIRGALFGASAGAVAVLFVRSYVRAEDIYRAMLARGYQGQLPELGPSRFQFADALFLLVGCLLPWTLRRVAEHVAL